MTKATIEKTIADMDGLLLKAYNEQPLPGLAVGVVYQGELVYTRAFGFANLEQQKPVSMDTVFRIMSISKTFTALGIMQLWEQKKFDLDDPVNPHLKAMKVQNRDEAAPPVSFRHLLTHTSGIGETRGWLDFTHPVVGLGARPDTRILSMPEYYRGRLSPEIYPGEKWSYANHAFAVLAQLIEDISGEPFDQYMRMHVFEPLGMLKTDYILSERVRAELAQGYTWKKGAFVPYPYLRLNTPGCGGIFSSVREMAKYATALMNGGENELGRIVKPATLKMMMTSQLESDPRVFSMGLGFFLEHYGKYLVAEHSGGWPGFISSLRVVPEAKVALMAFTNVSNGAPDRITSEILHRMLGIENPAEKIPDPAILLQPADWVKFCGSYGPKPGPLTNARLWMSMGGEVEVYVRGGQLMVRSLLMPGAKGIKIHRADPADPMLYQGVYEKSVMKILFHQNELGSVEQMSMGSNVLYKRPLQQSVRFRVIAGLGLLAGVLLAVLRRKRRNNKR